MFKGQVFLVYLYYELGYRHSIFSQPKAGTGEKHLSPPSILEFCRPSSSLLEKKKRKLRNLQWAS